MYASGGVYVRFAEFEVTETTGRLDFEFELVPVQLEVTLDGAPPPVVPSDISEPSFRFEPVLGRTGSVRELHWDSLTPQLDKELVPGEYRVQYLLPAGVSATSQPWPQQRSGDLGVVTVPPGGGVLALDVAPTAVVLDLAFDGVPISAFGAGSGESVSLLGADGRLLAGLSPWGWDGPPEEPAAPWPLKLLPGTYAVSWSTAFASSPDPSLPQGDVSVGAFTVSEQAADISLDVPTAVVSTTPRAGGLDVDGLGRGRDLDPSVSARQGEEHGAWLFRGPQWPSDEAVDATQVARLVPGRHEVAYRASSAFWTDEEVAATWPAGVAEPGALVVDASGALSLEVAESTIDLALGPDGALTLDAPAGVAAALEARLESLPSEHFGSRYWSESWGLSIPTIALEVAVVFGPADSRPATTQIDEGRAQAGPWTQPLGPVLPGEWSLGLVSGRAGHLLHVERCLIAE